MCNAHALGGHASADPTMGASDSQSLNEFSADAGFPANSQVITDADIAGDAAANIQPINPIPFPIDRQILPVIQNLLSGRYLGSAYGFELELRVDVDGTGALNVISGDFFTVSGATKTYFGSFRSTSFSASTSSTQSVFTCNLATTWSTPFNRVRVTIPRTRIILPPAAAQVQFINPSTGANGGAYTCNFWKRHFRTVRLEQDCTSGVTPFSSYNTGSLPSGGPGRVVSTTSAYTEAGIEMLNSGVANVVPMSLAGSDAVWSNAELHNAMVAHFSLYRNSPGWDVWLLHAQLHERGSGLYGIMFDQQGLHRQGCAVFYQSLAGTTADKLRLQAYTCVHEVGHCFNLLHSWQKSLGTPPKPNIPNSLSWMNYPWNYPSGGASGFWSNFDFRFDPSEIMHMRHGFYRDVVMGGNNFATGSSLHDVSAFFEDNVVDHPTLTLEIMAKDTYFLGEAVILETKLSNFGLQPAAVPRALHVNEGFLQVAIKKPGGEVVMFEPLAEMCIVPDLVDLDAYNPSVYHSSYIGFHKHGFLFDSPGRYQVKAIYMHSDGSRIVSNLLDLRVKSPVTAKDDAVADLMLDEEVGYLMSFMGSDADYLQHGNDNLTTIRTKYKDHPGAIYAQFVQGVNAERAFKHLDPSGQLSVRPPDHKEGEALLKAAIEGSKGEEGLDYFSVGQASVLLAKANLRQGKKKEAEKVIADLGKLAETAVTDEALRGELDEMAATALQPEEE